MKQFCNLQLGKCLTKDCMDCGPEFGLDRRMCSCKPTRTVQSGSKVEYGSEFDKGEFEDVD